MNVISSKAGRVKCVICKKPMLLHDAATSIVHTQYTNPKMYFSSIESGNYTRLMFSDSSNETDVLIFHRNAFKKLLVIIGLIGISIMSHNKQQIELSETQQLRLENHILKKELDYYIIFSRMVYNWVNEKDYLNIIGDKEIKWWHLSYISNLVYNVRYSK